MFSILFIGVFTFILAMLFEINSLYYVSYFLLLLTVILKLYHSNLIKKLEIKHEILDDHVFLNEDIRCRISLENKGKIPVFWLKVKETLPVKLGGKIKQGIVNLTPGELKKWDFVLKGRRRGYYRLGPLKWETGDIIGSQVQIGELEESNPLTVYPRIVSLEELGLPSRFPFGEFS